MLLKDIVGRMLKGENRSLSWLAAEMNMTFDGLKLSLLKGSLKYNDLKRMAVILKVQPNQFFNAYDTDSSQKFAFEEDPVTYANVKNELLACKELAEALKSQLKDKEMIIEMLRAGKQ